MAYSIQAVRAFTFSNLPFIHFISSSNTYFHSSIIPFFSIIYFFIYLFSEHSIIYFPLSASFIFIHSFSPFVHFILPFQSHASSSFLLQLHHPLIYPYQTFSNTHLPTSNLLQHPSTHIKPPPTPIYPHQTSSNTHSLTLQER